MSAIFSAENAVNMAYIHQLPDWPTFVWCEEALTVALADVRHRQGRLMGAMGALGFGVRGEAVLGALTDDAVTTSAIEGKRLDQAQVRSSLARRLGIEVAGLVPSPRDVDGLVELLLDATQNYSHALTRDRLFAWHAALFPTGRSGLTPILTGAWRTDATGPMQVVSGRVGRERVHFEAPPADALPAGMAQFLDWLNGPKAIDPVLAAGLAHLWFVTLHPFEDGNGRIARAIADMMLARSEGSGQRFYSMSAQISLERARYYDLLEATQRGGLNVTDWLAWFIACLGRAIDRAEAARKSIHAKALFWDALRDAPLNARQRLVLNRLLDGFEGKLTTSKWAALAKCSQDTAGRDIDALVRLGVLMRSAAGGRSTSYDLVGPFEAHSDQAAIDSTLSPGHHKLL